MPSLSGSILICKLLLTTMLCCSKEIYWRARGSSQNRKEAVWKKGRSQGCQGSSSKSHAPSLRGLVWPGSSSATQMQLTSKHFLLLHLLPSFGVLESRICSHQAAEELRGQHCRGAPARAPLAAPGALGLLPRPRGVTGAARTLAGGHGAVRAPGWVSASILWPPGFEGQAWLPRWQMLFPRFMPSQVLEPSCCSGLGCGGPRMQLQPGNRAGNTRDGRFLRCSATGVQRFKSPLTLLDRRL
ncbi:small integral membrane protein 43 isoform 1-T2 [Megaptera novaeangliae]